MNLHFFVSVSGPPEIEFQAELFARSLDWSGHHDALLTVCTGPEGRLTSRYLASRAEVVVNHNPLHLDPYWYGGLGHCPPKGDVTVYADADMLVLGGLDFLGRARARACGVIAYASPEVDWRKLFRHCRLEFPGLDYRHTWDGQPCPFYPNLGFVAVPTALVPSLNEALPEYLSKSGECFPGHYHRPQFAMCLALEAVGADREALPLGCNYPDLYPSLEDGADRAVVAHLLHAKSAVKDWASLSRYTRTASENGIRRRVKAALARLAGLRAI